MLQGKIPIAHENCYSLVYSILNNYKSLENIQAVALPKLRVCEILKMPVKLHFPKQFVYHYLCHRMYHTVKGF